MCCWCSCLECIHNIPPLNLLFLHFSDPALPGGGGGGAASGPVSMASISVPNPVPSATEDAENIRKAVQGILSCRITGIVECLLVSINTPFLVAWSLFSCSRNWYAICVEAVLNLNLLLPLRIGMSLLIP